jgi:hypothetical protein
MEEAGLQDAHVRSAHSYQSSEYDCNEASNIDDGIALLSLAPPLHLSRPGTPLSSSNLNNDNYNAAKTHVAFVSDNTTRTSAVQLLRWWLPELAASVFSIALLICTVVVLRAYEGHIATELQLAGVLSLNGLVALIASLAQATVTAPVCSAVLQEMWLYFAKEAQATSPRSRLQDIELFTHAASSTLGSLLFLSYARGAR